MHVSNYIYHHGEQELHGFLAYNDKIDKPRPAILIAHDWSGRNALACERAEMIANMGYVAFALDMYGQGRLGETVDEKMALMSPLANDRRLLRDRIRAAYDALIEMPEVDLERVAAIGFCFGGLCVLDLARSGLDFKAAISFHGLLNAPDIAMHEKIKAKILALHGYDDPMVKPEQVQAFCEEMTKAQADWQVYMYGNTQHAFTNPQAHDANLGTIYNPLAEKRAFQAMKNLLDEVFV